jgi:quercetin dioxygenase-like cupin family protein
MQSSGLVIGPEGGEVLHLRPPARSGDVTIKVDPKTAGSRRLAVGHQRLGPGGTIPVHLHERQDEVLFIHAGHAVVTLGAQRHSAPAGTFIFVPEGVWHGVENAGRDVVHLVWIITPPGLEDMFRAISAPPGTEAPLMTQEQFVELAGRHGMRVRPAGA